MISRKHYAEFAFPYSRKFVERMHELGVKVLVHICGDISDRLDLARDTGADVLSVDWKVDLADVRETFKDKAAFAGNFDPVKVMQLSNPDEIYNLAKQKLAEVGGDGNYILMPGCDIPHQVPLENIRAMIRAARG
jgi:uroporphyrinogen decarboxylase